MYSLALLKTKENSRHPSLSGGCFVLSMNLGSPQLGLAVKSSGSDHFPEALGSVLPPFICATAYSLVRSGAGFPSVGEIRGALFQGHALKFDLPILLADSSGGSAGDK